MNYLTSSKIRHFLSAFAGKSDAVNTSGQTVKNTNTTQTSASGLYWGHGFETEGLRWDEYGNPYVANDTVH